MRSVGFLILRTSSASLPVKQIKTSWESTLPTRALTSDAPPVQSKVSWSHTTTLAPAFRYAPREPRSPRLKVNGTFSLEKVSLGDSERFVRVMAEPSLISLFRYLPARSSGLDARQSATGVSPF